MPNSYSPIFTSLGISADAADLYTSLVQNGPQTAIQLAKSTQVKRTYVYKLCEQLIALGLARQEIKGKTTTFIAESPDRLVDIAASRQHQAETAAHSLENILPTLKSQFSASDTKPVVTYYEGIEGIKKIYLDTIKEKSPILALLEPSKIEPDLESWLQSVYLPLRLKANISARVLVSATSFAQRYVNQDKQFLRTTKLIPKADYPLQHEINIYGEKVALINNLAKDKLVGIVINHPLVVTTFRSWFELTWAKY